MSRLNTYWQKKKELNDWLKSIDYKRLAEWGSKKQRDLLMTNYNREINGLRKIRPGE